MATEILRLDLRLRRRAVVAYALGMGIYTFVVVAIYPAFQHDSGLDAFTKNNSTMAALFGANGSLTTSSGWLNANLYANFVPLILLLVTIGYGASCLAGQQEDGTLGLVAALPISRRGLALQKVAALSIQPLPVAVTTAACVVAGRGFDLKAGAKGLAGVTIGSVLLAVDFGAIALVIGTATGSRGTALGVTSALAAACYLISSLAPAVRWIRPARFASPFYYAVGNGQLASGLRITDAAVLLAIAAAGAIGALIAIERIDID